MIAQIFFNSTASFISRGSDFLRHGLFGLSNDLSVFGSKFFVLIIHFCFIFSLPIQAQRNGFFYDEMPTHIGSRSQGLGGAYTALVNDATAIYWNPGALGLLESSSFTSSFNFSIRVSEIESEASAGVFTSANLRDEMPHAGLNEVSIAIPIDLPEYNVRITPAFSYRQVSNYRFFKEIWDINYSSSPENLDYSIEYEHSGGMNAFSVGLGLSLSQHLGLGLVYNFYTGERTQNEKYIFSSNFGINEQFSLSRKTTFHGEGMVFGLKASTSTIDETVYLPGEKYESGIDFGFTVRLPNQRSEFMDFSNNSSSDTVTNIYNQPLLVRGGIAFRLPEAMISLDYSFADFSNTRQIALQQFTSARPFDQNARLQTISVGVEFDHMMRFGIMWRTYQFESALEESNQTYGLTGGLSFGDEDGFILDLSGMLEFFNWNVFGIGGLGENVIYSGVQFSIMASLRVFLD